jgi:hypothetical protein
MKKTEWFTVAIEGNCIPGTVQWEDVITCWHKHRTVESANKCRMRKAERVNVKWFNAYIHNQNGERV